MFEMERSLSMLGYDFPGGWALFVDDDEWLRKWWCNLLDQVQACSRTVCDAKILGLRVAQVTSIEKRKRANGVCCKMQKSRENGREDIAVTQWDMKKAFDHVDHRAVFKAMKLQGVSLFSMA